LLIFFFFSSRRRHTRFSRDWSSDVCSSDLEALHGPWSWPFGPHGTPADAFDDRRPASRGGRIMGQKINPIGLRLGVNRTWDSRRSEERRVGKESRALWDRHHM